MAQLIFLSLLLNYKYLPLTQVMQKVIKYGLHWQSVLSYLGVWRSYVRALQVYL